MAGGRPTVMTEAVVAKLEEAFACGCTDIEACLFAGISKHALYKYQNKHPEFEDRKEELKQHVKMRSKFLLSRSIDKDQNVEDAKWYLERKAKNEFSKSTEITGKDGESFAFVINNLARGDEGREEEGSGSSQ